MKKLLLSLAIAVLAAASLLPSSALAVEAGADAYVSVASKYLWRGFDLSDDDAFVVQPGADVTIGGFTVSWWGNMSENTGELNEVDLTLDYSLDIGELVSVSFGNILYDVDVDGANDTTNELYLSVALNTLLSPSLTAYYDYDEFEGNTYLVLGVGHDLELSKQLAASVGVSASYLYDDVLDDGWAHVLEVSGSLDYTVSEQVSVSLSGLYVGKLEDEAELYTGEDDGATAAVTVTYAF